jgi:Arc/MetJ-type ribon-helix-helix transcriptional regulator
MSDKCQTIVRQDGIMMERITIRLPPQQVLLLERLVEAGEFPTVSEAVRYSVRELLERHSGRVIRDSEQISFEV